MDSDRKSTVSSFYGGRKGSMDRLNQDFPSPTALDYSAPPGRTRDDASSFYNPGRASTDPFAGQGHPHAGYNRGSFFNAGREEPLKGGRDEEEADAGWDVYADFNNAGPRYSSAFGQQETGYQSLGPAPPESTTTTGPVEMVTVPALGPEWKKDELRDMTKAGKRERKSDARKALWRDWTRGNRGGRWCTKRFIVFACFGILAIVAVVCGICIPRVPSFALNNSTPLGSPTGSWKEAVPTEFSRSPANFSFPAFADLQVDTTSNYIPLNFRHLRATVYDLNSGFIVATGDLGHTTMPAKKFLDIQIPLNFSYVATNDSDATWNSWRNACQNKDQVTGGNRPGVSFRLVLNMNILGLIGSYGSSTQVASAPCPIELPSNSA